MARSILLSIALATLFGPTALAQPGGTGVCDAHAGFSTLPEEPMALAPSTELPAARARRAEALATTDASRPGALMDAAEALRLSGAHDEAVRVLSRIVSDHPSAAIIDRAMFRLGGELFALHRDDQARQVFMHLIRDQPSSLYVAAVYASFGDFYLAEGDADAAVQFFQRAADFTGRWQAYALYRLAWAHAGARDGADAVAALDRARLAASQPGALVPPGLSSAIQRERTAIAALARCP